MNSALKSSDAQLVAPAPWGEQAGRALAAAALATFVFAAWATQLDSIAQWHSRELRVLPTLSIFLLCALGALMVQGGRLSARMLLAGGFSAAILMLAIQSIHRTSAAWIESPVVTEPAETDAESHPSSESSGVTAVLAPEIPVRPPAPKNNVVTEWLRFELAIFAAILLGTWLGRGVLNSGQFVAFVLCATAGNIWLNTPMPGTLLAVPEAAGSGHALSLLRIPWPPQVGLIGLSPSLTEVLCFSAVLEASRNLKFHVVSILFGAFSGFCGGAFLALDPPAWPALPALMCGVGTLIASWPDLKMKAHDAVRALLIGVTLMTVLLGLTVLRKKLTPPPEPVPETTQYPGTT